MEVKVIGQMDNTIDHTFESANRVYDDKGLSPTINCCGGGGLQPKIIVQKSNKKCKVVEIPQLVKIRVFDVDIERLQNVLRKQKKLLKFSNKDISNALNIPLSQVEHYFRTDKSFAIPNDDIWPKLSKLLKIEDVELDKQIMTFEEKEGVFEKSDRHYLDSGIAPTILSGVNDKIIVKEPRVLGGLGNKKSNNGTQYYQQDRVYSSDGIAMCHPANIPGGENDLCRVEDIYRIRKLTPRECWRLMGFSDEDYEKAASVCSQTQLYKQAGNSICEPVLMAIFKEML